MPHYTYQCPCGLQFEAVAQITKHLNPKPCPACGGSAPRHMPSTVEGVFNHVTSGPGPQNTGVSALDTHIDRVIGRSAQQGWEAHTLRVADKRRVLVDTGADGHDLSRTPDGSWRVMTPEERKAVSLANRINNLALQTLSEQRKQRLG